MKRKSGCGSSVLAIALVFALVLGMDYVGKRIDMQRFPWAYAESGRPTLTGTWVGSVTTGGGKHLGMLVDMQMAPLDYHRRRGRLFRTRRSSWLIGRVEVCSAPGRVQGFKASGVPTDDNASHFRLSLSPVDSLPLDGLAPSHLRGQWDGRDALALEASLYLRRGKSAITSSGDADTGRDAHVAMKRGTESELKALCARL